MKCGTDTIDKVVAEKVEEIYNRVLDRKWDSFKVAWEILNLLIPIGLTCLYKGGSYIL
jgi:hypothetical protein